MEHWLGHKEESETIEEDMGKISMRKAAREWGPAW